MFLLGAIFVNSLEKTHLIKANEKNFHSLIEKSEYCAVFFTDSQSINLIKENSKMLNSLAEQFSNSLILLHMDVSRSPKFLDQYPIRILPCIAIFHKGTFRTIYNGEFSQKHIAQFFNSLTNPELFIIHNYFELYRFQLQGMPNILLTSSEAIKQAEPLLLHFSGIAKVGILDNSSSSLITQFNLPNVQVHNTISGIFTNMSTVNYQDITQALQASKYPILQNLDFSKQREKYIFVALYFLKDVAQRQIVDERFTYIKNNLARGGHSLPMFVIDFTTGYSITQQVGLLRFIHPLYIMFIRHPNGQYEMHPDFTMNQDSRVEQSPIQLLSFVKSFVAPNEMTILEENIQIPRMFADDFVTLALNPNHDVLMLIGNPQMKDYDAGVLNFKILMKLFQPYNSLKFYEYDATTEHVNGLQIVENPYPQISVWGAGDKKTGSTFSALYNINDIINALYGLIGTKFTDKQKLQILKKAEKIINDLQKSYENH